MITIKDLEGKWKTPAERRAYLIKKGMHAMNMQYPEADEYRAGITIDARQFLDAKCPIINLQNARDYVEFTTKRLVLNKLYQGILDRHSRIMELKNFIYVEIGNRIPSDYIENHWSPITEIIDIAYGRS